MSCHRVKGCVGLGIGVDFEISGWGGPGPGRCPQLGRFSINELVEVS